MNKDWEEAIKSGDVNTARLLFEGGANINARDKRGQTALMNAARLGHVDLVRLLVEAGAELNATAKYNLSALMLAIVNDHKDIARLLIEAGADVSIRGGKGAIGFFNKQAISLAEERGQHEIAKLLNDEGIRKSL